MIDDIAHLKRMACAALLLGITLASGRRVGAQVPSAIDFASAPRLNVDLARTAFSRIGDSDDRPESMFQSMSQAIRLSDGRLLIGDGSTHRLVLFDRRGDLVAVIGRGGAGPGERRTLTWARRQSADSIVVYDRSLRRVTQYVGADVTRLWSLSDYGPFDTPVDAVGMLSAARLVLRRSVSPASETGSTRARDELLILDLASRRTRRLVEFDGDEIFVRRSSSGGRILGTPPMRRASLVTVGSKLVAVGDSETGRILVINADSGSIREFEVRDGDRALTEAGITARLDEMLRESPRPVSPQWERLQREMIATQRFPAFGDLHLDETDRLWIQRWDRTRRGGQSWFVISTHTGETLQVDLPRYCRPTHITAELLTCVHSDPEELPSATTLRLVRRR